MFCVHGSDPAQRVDTVKDRSVTGKAQVPFVDDIEFRSITVVRGGDAAAGLIVLAVDLDRS